MWLFPVQRLFDSDSTVQREAIRQETAQVESIEECKGGTQGAHDRHTPKTCEGRKEY
jgi:hypothetical protein